MSDFKKKEQHQFWHSPIALLLLLGVLVVFVYNVVGLIKKDRETNEKKSQVLDDIENLEKRKIALSTDIKKLETDEGIEDVIREKFQVGRLNEKMVTIIDEEPNDIQQEEGNKKHGFLEWIKGVFSKEDINN